MRATLLAAIGSSSHPEHSQRRTDGESRVRVGTCLDLAFRRRVPLSRPGVRATEDTAEKGRPVKQHSSGSLLRGAQVPGRDAGAA